VAERQARLTAIADGLLSGTAAGLRELPSPVKLGPDPRSGSLSQPSGGASPA
jgi:hypothetical protein